MARCLSLMAQTLLFNGLALNLLNFVILQYILMLFPITSLSQWLFLLPGPASSSTDAVHTYRFIKSPSTAGQANLAPEEYVQMLHPEGWKTFYLAPDLLLSQPLCSKIYLPRAQKAGCEESTWYFCMILNVLQFCFAFHNQSFFRRLQLLIFLLKI